MVVVGELLLSAFFQMLFDSLASADVLNFVRQLGGGVDSELKKWENALMMIQAVLSDAEEKQLTDSAVKLWLDNLRDLAYDAEDILDEFATEALKHKSMPDQASTSKLKNLVLACFNCFSRCSMKSRIEIISSRLEELCQTRILLGLQTTPGGTSTSTQAQAQAQRSQSYRTSSVPEEPAAYGRDEDKAKILKMVLNDAPTDANFHVISIIGTPGVGKTKLAQDVYNDMAVDKFDLKAWVCVSDDFNVLSISKALVTKITSKPCNPLDIDEVQVQLKKEMDGKRFLLVFDDVWNENYNLWSALKAPFLAAAPKSKIIVTTRNSLVASTMGAVELYNLNPLSNEDCYSIFMMHAYEGRDINSHPISESLKQKVLAKCGGLPLAAKTLGGLLRSKGGDSWDEILNSNVLDLPQSGILPVLRLSYHYLPSHLKRCFAYFAVFPKDYEFEEKELVFLWMAEGIIQQSRDKKQPEVLGSEYFYDLLSRSMLQPSGSDNSKFVMHDLVHDLAQLVSGETGSRWEAANKSMTSVQKARHFSYIRGYCDGKGKFEMLHGVQHLRTFLPLSITNSSERFGPFITSLVISDLLQKYVKLRVLSLRSYLIAELPDTMRGLKLLRYLNLSATMIKSLPKSTSSLINLQILLLRDCSRLQKLPTDMRKLINLRHLDIMGANLIKEMPFGINELKNLHSLSNFIVGTGNRSSNLKDMKNLTSLGGELCISGLENVNDSREAREATLCEKQNIEALSLQWGRSFDNSKNEVVEESVLDMLRPNRNIKKLVITNYGGKSFPSWVGDPSFSNLTALELRFCRNCRSLPALGLLGSLKELTVKGMTGLKSIGSEIYGEDRLKPFQLLETLHFEDLEEWENWDMNTKENGHVVRFPSLQELSIVECPRLSGKLPEYLPSLETLIVHKCAELVVSFSCFPNLCRLDIDGCKGLTCNTPIDANSVNCMTVSNSSLQINGCRGMIYNDCPAAETNSLPNSVTISNILEFGKFLKQGFEEVETLWIGDSQQFKLWRDSPQLHFKKPEQGLHVLTFPEEVSIEECCISLVSYPEINFLPNNLRSLKIGKDKDLKSLPEEIIGSSSRLESLYITDCDSLTFIARRKLPSSLKWLEIKNCKNLQHVVDSEEDAVTCSIGTLKHIKIEDCPKLESIPDGLHYLNCLQEIFLEDCPSLVSFLKRGLPSTISSVHIFSCEKLEALPSDLHKLNSLEHLWISQCPSIVSFPEEGFPTNLTSLRIEDVKMFKALIQWGLHRLTSLRALWIIDECHDAECFPDEEMGMMLPTSLSDLRLWGLPKLKYLSSTCFQSLTSLESLWIDDCPNLTALPEVGLPSSLVQLRINHCPLLTKKCKREKGKEWSKIAHIPGLVIDCKCIYDEE